MATIGATAEQYAQPTPRPTGQEASPAGAWGNSAPLGLATFFVLGAGNYYGSAFTVETGGYMGLVVAFLAAYLSCAELCEASYKRTVLPVWPLTKH
jgi:hypothetical protein